MRWSPWLVLIGAVGLGAPVWGQAAPPPTRLASPAEAFGAPGSYGVAFGAASFGVPRTYSAYSSPYGGGYGYGHAPATILPGRFGNGLWRPASMAGGAWDRPSSYRFYRTFPYPSRPGAPAVPLGYYAPSFGPPSFDGW